MFNELQLSGIGRERETAILQSTFTARRHWIINCKPSIDEFFNKFPQLAELGVHVSTIVALPVHFDVMCVSVSTSA